MAKDTVEGKIPPGKFVEFDEVSNFVIGKRVFYLTQKAGEIEGFAQKNIAFIVNVEPGKRGENGTLCADLFIIEGELGSSYFKRDVEQGYSIGRFRFMTDTDR